MIQENNRALQSVFGETLELMMGTCNDSKPSVLGISELLTGMLFLGRSGTGKSKAIQHLIRQLSGLYVPTVVIDAEGDLSEDCFIDVIEEVRNSGSESKLHRVHYLLIDWKKIFTFDPFRYEGMPNHPRAYRAWLQQRCEKMANAIIRAMGETGFNEMPRLRRILTNLLYAIGVTVGPNNARLPLGYIFVLLNFEHPKFDRIYGLVKPNLPAEIAADFEQLLSLRNRPQDVLAQTESCVNRLRASLSIIVQGVFSEVGQQTLDLHELIRARSLIIFNLRDSNFFSAEQADQLGKIVIYMVISTMQSIDDRGDRIATTLVVDECQRFITDDILTGLARGRKWGLMTILATQMYSSLEMVQEKFGEMVLGLVGTVCCFQQRLESDLDILTPYLFRPNYILDEHFQEVDRHRGYDWIDVVERSENWSTTTTIAEACSRILSTSRSRSNSRSLGRAISRALASAQNWSHSKSKSKSKSLTSNRTRVEGSGEGQSLPLLPLDAGGGILTINSHKNSGVAQGDGFSEGEAIVEGEAKGGAIARVEGEAENEGVAEVNGQATGEANGSTTTVGTANSTGGGRSFKKIPLARIIPELQATGRFRYPIEMQNEVFKSQLAQLPRGVAALRRDGIQTEILHVPFIDDPFPDPKLRRALIEVYLQKLQAIHPYWTEPDMSEADYEKTLDEFIANATAPAAMPVINTVTPVGPF